MLLPVAYNTDTITSTREDYIYIRISRRIDAKSVIKCYRESLREERIIGMKYILIRLNWYSIYSNI